VTFTRIIGTSLKIASLHPHGYGKFSEHRNYIGTHPWEKKAQKNNPFFTGEIIIAHLPFGVKSYLWFLKKFFTFFAAYGTIQENNIGVSIL